MSRSVLLLAVHGSRHRPEVNAAVRALAASLDLPPDYDEVCTGFHQGSPGFAEAIGNCAADRVTVVPIMTSHGHYADRVLPRELARGRPPQTRDLVITEPVGRHLGMGALLAERVEQLLHAWRLDAAQVTVALVGHGTRRNPHSRRTTVHWASQLGYTTRIGQTLAVFLDDEPGLDALLQRARSRHLIVLPFLIGAGPHATEDIPAALGMTPAGPSGSAGFPLVQRRGDRILAVDRPVGQDPAIARLVRDLAEQPTLRWQPSLPPRPLRLGTRSSKLALWQARHVTSMLRAGGWPVEIVELATSGDRDRLSAIAELPGDAPFTDDIDVALASGAIDLAVHSRKDLPTHMSREFELAAVLPRGDVREALVARDHLTLATLPPGATVGTSSPRRAAQVRALRPDLAIRPLRGPVDDRVRQVRDGKLDAAILAVAGLERLGMLCEAAEIFAPDVFVPAPAQAALAVQVRAGDELAACAVADLDDSATRAATDLEWRLLAAFDDRPNLAVAAYAQAADDEVRVHVRVLDLQNGQAHDLHAAGATSDAVWWDVIARLPTSPRQPAGATR